MQLCEESTHRGRSADNVESSFRTWCPIWTPLVGDGVLQSVDTALGGVRLVESVAIKRPQMTVWLIKAVKAAGEETPLNGKESTMH